jgi:hypothetical protein
MPTTLDAENPTQEQIAAYDSEYLASLSPGRKKLYAGTYGIPGAALGPHERMQEAFALGATEKVDLMTDGIANSPAMIAINRVRSHYVVFSYIFEPNPDWATAPPGQDLPNRPPYNPEGHTGIVSLTAPGPYAGPKE